MVKSHCPVCGSDSVTTFLTRRQVPVHQNLVLDSQAGAREIARGDLELGVCEACGFTFNQAFDGSKLQYGAEYDNTQTHSPFFQSYVSGLVRHLVCKKKVQNTRIVEIGCGKGTFLRALVEFEGAGNTGYGFDPSYVGPEVDLEDRLRFVKRFYDQECSHIPADVIVCRHVIEHIPDPVDFLRLVKQALVRFPHARLFFETPNLDWIFHNQVVWDFFYEHCSYFTPESLTTAFEIAGFRVENIQQVFGGQYLWLEGRMSSKPVRVATKANQTLQSALQFAVLEKGRRHTWLERIKTLRSDGPIALWGAGAKGVTFANLLDPHQEWIVCVVDLNPNKQGCYLAGTAHPVVGYRELVQYQVATAIVLNPNYLEENLSLLRDAQISVRLVTFE